MERIQLQNQTDIQVLGLRVKHMNQLIHPNAALSLTRSVSNEPIELQRNFEFDRRHAALHFILNGQTTFSQNGRVPTARFSGDKCNLMLIQPHSTVQTMAAKGDFVMASFYIELDYFIGLLNVAVDALPEKFQKAVYKNVCSCNNTRWSPQAYYTISQILNLGHETLNSGMFLESKMLELIAAMLQTEQCDYYSNITITRSDIEKIHFVQDYMLANLSDRFTLDQLARKACTNEFTLKKGFKEVIGKPVYQYLQQKRMEMAMDMLLSTQLPVSEISVLVGYEDASAFTRAFKKVFHLLPAMIRKNSVSA